MQFKMVSILTKDGGCRTHGLARIAGARWKPYPHVKAMEKTMNSKSVRISLEASVTCTALVLIIAYGPCYPFKPAIISRKGQIESLESIMDARMAAVIVSVLRDEGWFSLKIGRYIFASQELTLDEGYTTKYTDMAINILKSSYSNFSTPHESIYTTEFFNQFVEPEESGR